VQVRALPSQLVFFLTECTLHCEVMKQAAIPSCLGGGEDGINAASAAANRPVQVRALPLQLLLNPIAVAALLRG
jgi:hypothetical protein